MEKAAKFADPAAYVASLTGWQRGCVHLLRTAVHAAAKVDEVVKWGHLVYRADGPVLLIRAEAARVLFGFWRGQRLQEIEPRLKRGGKYQMAAMELREGDSISPAVIRQLVRTAVALNRDLGDPTAVAKAEEQRQTRFGKRPA